MRKQMIQNAAFEVATQVRAVEDTIDSALAEIAELQARIMRVDALARQRGEHSVAAVQRHRPLGRGAAEHYRDLAEFFR